MSAAAHATGRFEQHRSTTRSGSDYLIVEGPTASVVFRDEVITGAAVYGAHYVGAERIESAILRGESIIVPPGRHYLQNI